MLISLCTFLEISLFLTATIYGTTQNFYIILTVWTKIERLVLNLWSHFRSCFCKVNRKNRNSRPQNTGQFAFLLVEEKLWNERLYEKHGSALEGSDPHELTSGIEVCQMKGKHIGASELTLFKSYEIGLLRIRLLCFLTIK